MGILSAHDARQFVSLLEELAREALIEDFGLDDVAARARLAQELDYYRGLELSSQEFPAIYRRFCVSLANRGGMYNLVFGGSVGAADTERRFKRVLCGFDPARVAKRYGRQPDVLLARLLNARGLTGAQAERQATEARAGFPLYARGLLAGADYFSQFDDSREFVSFIEKWRTDPDLVQMLPHYFAAQGIPGFGATLAADFLKELGLRELGKPERWVYRILLHGRFIEEGASEFAVQRALWALWKQLGDGYPPAILDKLMFLIGSGRFEMVAPYFACRSRFGEFCRRFSSPRCGGSAGRRGIRRGMTNKGAG